MIKTTNATILYDTDKDIYDIKLESPLSVCWQITTSCNLNCKYCLSSSGSNGCYGLSTKDAISVIEKLGKLGVNRLDFTGGEPLLRKDLKELITFSKANNINTIVTTNTTLLNDKNIEALKAADLIQISIDGPKEIHNEQRQADVYDKTIDNIKKLKGEGCKIRLNSFIFNSNKQYVPYLINLSKELELFSHLFIIFTPQGRGKEHLEEIIPEEEVEKIKEEILTCKETEGRNIRLYDYNEYLHSCVLLTPLADVISQGFYEEDSVKVGNMLETPLEELFANPIFDHPTHVMHYLQRRVK
ncbi:MAG: radical SAM protein [Clostridia bacterium]